MVGFTIYGIQQADISNYKLSGKDVFPQLNLDFEMFSFYMLQAALSLLLLAALGVLTSFCKKPYCSWAYTIAALCISAGCVSASYTCSGFEPIAV